MGEKDDFVKNKIETFMKNLKQMLRRAARQATKEKEANNYCSTLNKASEVVKLLLSKKILILTIQPGFKMLKKILSYNAQNWTYKNNYNEERNVVSQCTREKYASRLGQKEWRKSPKKRGYTRIGKN